MPHSHNWPARRQRAFTLIEIAVVVMIIGVLIALTLPGYRRIHLKSQATAVTNDLRSFANSFINYNLSSGWPSGGYGPGVIPPEMTGVLSNAFTQSTPIGGNYEWLVDTGAGKAVLKVSNVNNDVDLLEMVDGMIDDGNLSTGSLTVSGPDLIYVIEK